MATTYYPPEKRLDKLSPRTKDDITFDLINAFGMVKNPLEAAMLLQDLLTKKELDNLSKRLQIAKLLLEGKKQEEIIEKLHCGFSLIARVRTWLDEGGDGLRRIIKRLPKRREYPEKSKFSPLPPEYRMPQLVWKYIQYMRAYSEEAKIKKFFENVEDKALIDKQLKDSFDDYYRTRHSKAKNK
ncbi:hypothetical protein HYZ78_02300 [Candidatus Microgenomates bacterium]|nr:hypothetical protein [Candidatus Microgenomates bacterium]